VCVPALACSEHAYTHKRHPHSPVCPCSRPLLSYLQVVLDLSLQLYSMYLVSTPRMRPSPVTKGAHTTPSMWLSAVLLVSVKLLYGLGNAAGTVSRHVTLFDTVSQLPHCWLKAAKTCVCGYCLLVSAC
jgi:hypothetical protein